MKISNPSLLRSYRKPGKCDFCGKQCSKREPAHIVSVGAGGSDLACNLVALGSSREPESQSCRCHSLSHAGKSPTKDELLDIVAKRDGCNPEVVLAAINFVRNLDKGASKYRIQEEMLRLPAKVREIVARELKEVRKIP